MKPIEFAESNQVLLPPEKVPNCESLPVWSDGHQCVSCWKLSLRDRLIALIFGKVWIAVLSGHTQPPIALSVERKYFRDAPTPK